LLKQLEGNKMMCRDGKYHTTGWLDDLQTLHQVLYSVGRIDWDTYSGLLLTIPGRKYGRKLVQKPILKEDILDTLKKLRDSTYTCYTS